MILLLCGYLRWQIIQRWQYKGFIDNDDDFIIMRLLKMTNNTKMTNDYYKVEMRNAK